MSVFDDTLTITDELQTQELRGVVAHVQGLTLKVADLSLPVGAMVRILARSGELQGEVVGFDHEQTLVMPLGDTTGVRRGDRVVADHLGSIVHVGYELLGRVIDGMGRPRDGGPTLRTHAVAPLRPRPVDPMYRVPIDQPLGTGVRAIDSMLSVGRGQRLGVFAGPGVGKSTILGMMARQTDADVSVIALIGERGREVQDFLINSLGEEGLARSVVITATGDEPALMRIRAALVATSVAEFFRDQGHDVMLLMDSVTRFAQAARQVGLAAGEPPATKGYTPSVFSMLPSLLERTGRTQAGSITGFYSILVEGDDLTEPVSDACRGILDGHVVLDRDLANSGHWPAIDVLGSVSRVADDVTTDPHRAARAEVSRLIHSYRQVEDLVNIGAYAEGANPDFDLAIAMRDPINQLLRQKPGEPCTFENAHKTLIALALRIGQAANIQQGQRR